MLLTLASILACSLAARGFHPQSRTVQSQAICTSDFAWADNSKGESPCQVAANLDALCNNNNWLIPALNASVSYTVPTGIVATFCTCSWASYNLISACQACQSFPDQIPSWTSYTVNCGGKLSDTYFPSNLTLPQGTQIPFWATTNPTNWSGERFNPATAKSIASQGHADVGSASPSSKSTPIGAIVGGVIGGIVVLLAAILIGIYLIRRTSKHNSNGGPSSMCMTNLNHLRSHSDVIVKCNDMSTPALSYTSFSSTPAHLPTCLTTRAHGTSSVRSSFPFSSAGSIASSPLSVLPQSLPLVHRDESEGETAVEPFMLRPTSKIPNPDRKQANIVYGPSSSPPPHTAMGVEVQPTTPTQGGKARYNPPAYTEQTEVSPEAGGGSSSRRHPPPTASQARAKRGSTDTQHSITSSRSGGATRAGGRGSISAMGNVINELVPIRTAINSQQDPFANASTSAHTPTRHGRQLRGNTSSNTSMRRLTDIDDGLSARYIA